MALNGDIQTVSLGSILQLLSNEKKTGVLRVKNDQTEYQFFMLEGYIIYAIQAKKEARLGTMLRDQGIVNQDQINEALKLSKEKKQSLGKSLIEKGYITFEILERFVYKQVEEIIFNLFQWDSGEFEYTDSDINLRWIEVVKLNTMTIIMDAARRIDELCNDIRIVCPTCQKIYRIPQERIQGNKSFTLSCSSCKTQIRYPNN
ncbi:MAG: DUF4388 domain-containing protein [Desulfobacterales bacterium]|nr:DUF4388 domain-containing protein [Desulfobacterales bacterium]